jgi:hypothetical protein
LLKYNTGDSNFQVLLGDVDLGPLSERPELFKVAAVENEVVNVTDDQQTAVVTVGVNIRLDWSSWVTELLAAESAFNTTFTYYRTQLNESGIVIAPGEVLTQSERISIEADEELSQFYVEISSIIVSPENESDRAIYELEACVTQADRFDGNCLISNITVYAIERPDAIGKH